MSFISPVTELDIYLKSLGIPIHGVRQSGGTYIVDYNGATAQQITNGDAIAAGWASDPEAGEVKARRRLATLLLDRPEDLETLLRAIVLESLGYTNAKLTIMADTLRAKNVITLAERNNFVNGLATPAQARTAIKNRIAAGEADNGS